MDKFLADAQVGSRGEIEELGKRGCLRVNGEVVFEPRKLVDPQSDVIEVSGRRVHLSPPQLYVLLHKPAGVVTTLSDPAGRRCITELLPVEWQGRVGVVGRLDKPTTGALIVTDDGDLSHLMTHPEFHVWKRYVMTVLGEPLETDPRLEQMRSGIQLGPTLTQPARCGVAAGSGRAGEGDSRLSEVWIELREGRNRQVRRMASHVRLKLLHLHRATIGPIQLGDLAEGQWRLLAASEVDALYDAAGGRQTAVARVREALKRRLEAGTLEGADLERVRRYFDRTGTSPQS
ncbi:MAG: hypothetical protein AUK47_28810 [Deltaproteobacteria bacterium CG2_30_63_29]|nr:MAG: hypothetical protein AUK47_28810 [Deltaproteobacteria bacterium CG2_30_63_29]